jgi:hypothetical protein
VRASDKLLTPLANEASIVELTSCTHFPPTISSSKVISLPEIPFGFARFAGFAGSEKDAS